MGVKTTHTFLLFPVLMIWRQRILSAICLFRCTGSRKLKAFQVRPEAIPSKVQIIKKRCFCLCGRDPDRRCFSHRGRSSRCFRTSFCLFFTEPQENGISITVKGNGHGYGLSQCEAQAKAAEGWDFKQILEYFYSDIEFCTE